MPAETTLPWAYPIHATQELRGVGADNGITGRRTGFFTGFIDSTDTLVVCANRELDDDAVITPYYSDDGGETWTAGTTPATTNDPQMRNGCTWFYQPDELLFLACPSGAGTPDESWLFAYEWNTSTHTLTYKDAIQVNVAVTSQFGAQFLIGGKDQAGDGDIYLFVGFRDASPSEYTVKYDTGTEAFTSVDEITTSLSPSRGDGQAVAVCVPHAAGEDPFIIDEAKSDTFYICYGEQTEQLYVAEFAWSTDRYEQVGSAVSMYDSTEAVDEYPKGFFYDPGLDRYYIVSHNTGQDDFIIHKSDTNNPRSASWTKVWWGDDTPYAWSMIAGNGDASAVAYSEVEEKFYMMGTDAAISERCWIATYDVNDDTAERTYTDLTEANNIDPKLPEKVGMLQWFDTASGREEFAFIPTYDRAGTSEYWTYYVPLVDLDTKFIPVDFYSVADQLQPTGWDFIGTDWQRQVANGENNTAGFHTFVDSAGQLVALGTSGDNGKLITHYKPFDQLSERAAWKAVTHHAGLTSWGNSGGVDQFWWDQANDRGLLVNGAAAGFALRCWVIEWNPTTHVWTEMDTLQIIGGSGHNALGLIAGYVGANIEACLIWNVSSGMSVDTILYNVGTETLSLRGTGKSVATGGANTRTGGGLIVEAALGDDPYTMPNPDTDIIYFMAQDSGDESNIFALQQDGSDEYDDVAGGPSQPYGPNSFGSFGPWYYPAQDRWYTIIIEQQTPFEMLIYKSDNSDPLSTWTQVWDSQATDVVDHGNPDRAWAMLDRDNGIIYMCVPDDTNGGYVLIDYDVVGDTHNNTASGHDADNWNDWTKMGSVYPWTGTGNPDLIAVVLNTEIINNTAGMLAYHYISGGPIGAGGGGFGMIPIGG